MGVSKTSDFIRIKIKMQNSSQEPSISSKAPNQDLGDMDDICTFKMKIESQNSEHGLPETSDHIQIKIKMPNFSQEPSTPLKPQIRTLRTWILKIVDLKNGSV